jgi:hypothetical protein
LARYKMPGSCPVCGGKLDITSLSCRNCSTAITGRFESCRFCRLSPEHLSFVEVFVKNRGNIKEIERELGISYPTVRNRLDQVIAALGYSVGDASVTDMVAGSDDDTDTPGAPSAQGTSGTPGTPGPSDATNASTAAAATARREIVEALSRGEISAEEAVRLLKSRTR